MTYNLLLRKESFKAIDLRIQGKTWKQIDPEHIKYVRGLRKSEIYLRCVIEVIKKIGLNSFEIKSARKGKDIVSYFEKLFGIDKTRIGEVVDGVGIETYYEFEKNDEGRDYKNSLQKYGIGIGDCAVRTFSSAFGITYKESEKLCIENRFFKYEKDPIVNGVSDSTIYKIFKLNGWGKINYISHILSKKINLNNLLNKVPELKNENIVVGTDGHIFYVEKGCIKDTYPDAFSNIEYIFSSDETSKSISKIIRDTKRVK